MRILPLSKFLKAFSLTELLVALSILAIVAAVVVPRFLNVRDQADVSVAKQIASELNNTYANWKASGGTVTSTGMEYGTTVLQMIGSNPGTTPSVVSVDGSTTLKDSEVSSNIRVSLPDNLQISDLQNAGDTNCIQTEKYSIFYSGETFTVIPNVTLRGATWSNPIALPNQQVSTGVRYFPLNITLGSFSIPTGVILPNAVYASTTFYGQVGNRIYKVQATGTSIINRVRVGPSLVLQRTIVVTSVSGITTP